MTGKVDEKAKEGERRGGRGNEPEVEEGQRKNMQGTGAGGQN